MDFLKRIQSRSRTQKMQYSFTVAVLITGIIGTVWATTLPAKFANFSLPKPSSSEKTKELTDMFADTKSQLGSIVETTKQKEDVMEELPTSNLGALDTLETSEIGTGQNFDAQSPATIPTASAISEPALQPAVENEITESVTLDPERESTQPRVILIGTTTSQKLE